ncbi:hypothetical protein JW968_03530 [Candidatus Woesearchaeota archaeon]|nr:hypothetical protein [Candidatus Woesearchaeota archaeon]
MREFLVIREAKKALHIVRKNLKLFLTMVILDFVMLFFLGFFGSEIVNRIINEMIILFDMMAKIGMGMDFLFNPGQFTEVGQVVFFQHRTRLFMYFFVLVCAVYLLYSLFQGINWYLTKQIENEKLGFWRYLGRFFAINLLWFSSMTIVFAVTVRLSYLKAFVITPKLIQIIVIVFAFLFALVITYLAPISYSILMHNGFVRKAFVLPFRDINVFFPMYLLLVFLFLIADFILLLTSMAHPVMWLIAGLVFFLPLFSFSRIYINLVANKIIR